MQLKMQKDIKFRQMDACKHTHIYICGVYVCIYIYTHIYIHIYMYTLCILRKPAEGSGWRVCIGRSYGEANLGGGGAGGSGSFPFGRGRPELGGERGKSVGAEVLFSRRWECLTLVHLTRH